MNKKIWISGICLVLAFFIFFIIWTFIDKDESNSIENENFNINETENNIEISEGIEDECTEEWKEYNSEFKEVLKETSNNLSNSSKRYLIKSVDGYINIYTIPTYDYVRSIKIDPSFETPRKIFLSLSPLERWQDIWDRIPWTGLYP